MQGLTPSPLQPPVTKTLLIAWDAADWHLLEPMLEAGELPNLDALLSRGLLGRFPVPHPLDPAAIATSLSTGYPPDLHGLLAEGSPARDRRVADLAERFAGAGRLAISVGWPGTQGRPAMPNLLNVSDLFDSAPPASMQEHWPLPEGAVEPEALAAEIAELRMHPGEFSPQDLAPLIAGAGETDLAVDRHACGMALHLAAAVSRQSAATYLMENHAWEFAAVYFPGIGGVCREALQFHPPRLPHVSAADFERYHRAVTETCKLHDQMLGQLAALAGPEAAIVLCATRGVECGEARPSPLPGEHIEAASFFRGAGFCVARAPGFREDDLLHAIQIGDLAPTLLWLAGLPVPAGMRVLDQAVARPGSFPNPIVDRMGPVPQPIELGEEADPTRKLHLAICHLNAGRPEAALALLEAVCAAQPERIIPVMHRITCLRTMGRTAEARELLESLAARAEGGLRPRPGLRAKFVPRYDMMRGLLHLDDGQPGLALPCLQAALASQPQHAGLHILLARTFLGQRRWADAEAALAKALTIAPDEGEAHFLMADLLYKLRRHGEAIQPAMEAAARLPHLPQVHLLLGYCLARAGRDADAIACLENALRRAPALRPAHRLLGKLLHKVPGKQTLAALHAQAARYRPAARQ